MPTVPVLLSAASFTRQRTDGSMYLAPPQLPDRITARGADCGGFTAALRWNGVYRFTPLQYAHWLDTWQPQWAAVMDLPCLSETLGDPGPAVVRERQQYTTSMAELFWSEYRCASWCWCPTITGWHPSDYERHARELAPLIRAMFLYYLDPGWGEPEDDERGYPFRVGIGSLCGRAKPAFLLDIIERVADIIGLDIPLHCWGVKLKTLQSGVSLPGVISIDSGAWNNLFGKEHERRRASGLTVVGYSWQVSHPAYERKVIAAQARLQQHSLDFGTSAPVTDANDIRHRIADSLAEEDGIAEQLLYQFMNGLPSGASAAAVIRHEQEELGNDLDLPEWMIEELENVPACRIVWVCQTREHALRYGDDPYREDFDPKSAFILATDQDHGCLILEDVTLLSPTTLERFALYRAGGKATDT